MKRPHQVLGEAWLLGSAGAAFFLMLLSIAGIRWSRGSLIAAIVVAIGVWLFRHRATRFEWPRLEWANAIDLVTLALMIGYARVITLASPVEADYYTMWGMKAKQFLAVGGIDFKFLTDPVNIPLHVDYPMLQPLLYDAFGVLIGGWPDERWLGVLFIATGTAALLVVRALLADELSKLERAIATLIVMPLVFSPYFGMPEAPLIAYGTIGLLLLRRAVRDDDSSFALHGAVYLGLAASCKNEGITLAFAAAVGLAISRRRLLLSLWPTLAIMTPWLLLMWRYTLVNDLVQGNVLGRLLARLRDPVPLMRALYELPHGRALLWLGIAFAWALGAQRIVKLKHERFLAVALLLQLSFFLVAYCVTPHDYVWHITWSWERILRQILPSMALLALLVTVVGFRVEERNAPVP